jgi:hypothetical protein
MKNKNGAIVVGVVSLLFVGTAIYFVIKGLRTKKTPQVGDKSKDAKKDENKDAGTTSTTTNTETNIPTTSTTTTQETYTEFKFPIRLTQKNDSVRKLQELLLKVDSKLLPKFGADSYFGTETESALYKVLGKKSVVSQSDIEKIKDKAKAKTIGLLSMQNALASIGIK